MDGWKQYLHREHSEEELAEWARRLRAFRFCRALGGHANDGDQLLIALAHSGSEDLKKLWNELGCASPTGGTIRVSGVSVVVVQLEDRILLSLAGAKGDPFAVTEQDVANAEAVERTLHNARARLIDPPIDDRHCVAPKYYPEFWIEGHSNR